jgi:hypothetical protein
VDGADGGVSRELGFGQFVHPVEDVLVLIIYVILLFIINNLRFSSSSILFIHKANDITRFYLIILYLDYVTTCMLGK